MLPSFVPIVKFPAFDIAFWTCPIIVPPVIVIVPPAKFWTVALGNIPLPDGVPDALEVMYTSPDISTVPLP